MQALLYFSYYILERRDRNIGYYYYYYYYLLILYYYLMNNFHKNDWFRKLLNTAFREKPPRCSRMGALILLPSLNPPFREKPPRCSRKGAAIPAPPPLRERRRSLQAVPRGATKKGKQLYFYFNLFSGFNVKQEDIRNT